MTLLDELKRVAVLSIPAHPIVREQVYFAAEFDRYVSVLVAATGRPYDDVRRAFAAWVGTQPGTAAQCYNAIMAGNCEWQTYLDT